MKKRNWCRRCNKAMTEKQFEDGETWLVCEHCGKIKPVSDKPEVSNGQNT
jgi:translation initiation factor 2 beta subunit (eIF-2beta)/eIF-5